MSLVRLTEEEKAGLEDWNPETGGAWNGIGEQWAASATEEDEAQKRQRSAQLQEPPSIAKNATPTGAAPDAPPDASIGVNETSGPGQPADSRDPQDMADARGGQGNWEGWREQRGTLGELFMSAQTAGANTPVNVNWGQLGQTNGRRLWPPADERVGDDGGRGVGADVDAAHEREARRAEDKAVQEEGDALEAIVPGLKSAPDRQAARQAIEAHFNQEYAAPAANARQGWFSDGDYTEDAAKLRQRIDADKAAATYRLEAVGERAEALRATRQRAEEREAQMRASYPPLTSREVELSPRYQWPDSSEAQIEYPDAESILAGRLTEERPERATEPKEDAPTPFKADEPAFRVSGEGAVTFDPERLVSGLTAARDAGVIDPVKYAELLPMAQEAEKAMAERKKLLANDNISSKLKALGYGATKGAAFLAAAPAGAGIGAEIGVIGGPIGIAAGGAIGGLVAGTAAAWALDKVVRKLGEYNRTIQSFTEASDTHPYFDAAGNLVAVGVGIPRAGARLIGQAVAGRAGAGAKTVSRIVAEQAAIEKAVASGATLNRSQALRAALEPKNLRAAMARSYESAGGGAAGTVRNLAEEAALRRAAGASAADVAAGIAARVGTHAAANVALDTVVKEGAHALGWSQEGQTLPGAVEAAILGAFSSGHGITYRDYSSQEIGSLLQRAREATRRGVDPRTVLNAAEYEAAEAAAREMQRVIVGGEVPANPTVSVRQARQHGGNYGVSASRVEGSAGLPLPAPTDGAAIRGGSLLLTQPGRGLERGLPALPPVAPGRTEPGEKKLMPLPSESAVAPPREETPEGVPSDAPSAPSSPPAVPGPGAESEKELVTRPAESAPSAPSLPEPAPLKESNGELAPSTIPYEPAPAADQDNFNAGAPSEAISKHERPESADAEPRPVDDTTNQAPSAPPAPSSEAPAREWGDVEREGDTGATIETRNGKRGVVTAVKDKTVRFRTEDGTIDAASIANARVVETSASQNSPPALADRPWRDIRLRDIGQWPISHQGRRAQVFQVKRGAGDKKFGIRRADASIERVPGETPQSRVDRTKQELSAAGTAQYSSIEWRDNADGTIRDFTEVRGLAKSYGVLIPDYVDFFPVPEGSLGTGVFASYGGFKMAANAKIAWADLCLSGRILVKIDVSLLPSDEGIVGAIGHEMHELNKLKEYFDAAPGGKMSFSFFRSLVDAESNGRLHLQALHVTNELIKKVREKRK